MLRDVSIRDFRQDVQEYINKNGLDINKDSLINKDNGELAKLLSAAGVDDVNKLYNSGKLRSGYTSLVIGSAITGAGIGYVTEKFTSHETFMNAHKQYNTQLQEANRILEQYNASVSRTKTPDFWNETLKQLRTNIAQSTEYTPEDRSKIIQTIDETLKKRGDNATSAEVFNKTKREVVTKLKQLHKPPFLLRARNLIKNCGLAGIGLSVLSTLFFGYKAATTSASHEKLAFQQ